MKTVVSYAGSAHGGNIVRTKKKDHKYEVIRDLTHRRVALNVHQKDLARAIGCTKHEISEWENEKYTPRLTTLIAWAQVLGLELAAVDRRKAPQ